MGVTQEQFNVGGLSCSFCAESIRTAYERAEGVEDVDLSLAHEKVLPGFPAVHFFAVSVFITTYHLLSEYTSLVVRTRASQAVQRLLDLRPDTARRVETDGDAAEQGSASHSEADASEDVEEVSVDELAVGDRGLTVSGVSRGGELVGLVGIGVAAATSGLVHPVFAMVAMVLSVSAVLANSFAGQLLSGEGVTTRFAVREGTDDETDEVAGQAATS